MRNRIAALLTLCALLLCVVCSASAASDRLADQADLFTASEETQIRDAIEDFVKETGFDFVVVTSKRAYDEDTNMQDVVDRVYEDNGFGLGDDRSGMIYFIDMYGRREYISAAGAMMDYITGDRRDAAFDKSNPYLRTGSYAQAALTMIAQMRRYVAQGIPEGQYRYDVVTGQRLTARHKALTAGEIGVSALAGAVVALIVGLCIHRKYKLKGSTYHYDMQGNANVRLTEQSDDYIRTTASRTRKAPPPSSGGSGGGGGFGGGTGVHTSSGGMSHTGGSRGF